MTEDRKLKLGHVLHDLESTKYHASKLFNIRSNATSSSLTTAAKMPSYVDSIDLLTSLNTCSACSIPDSPSAENDTKDCMKTNDWQSSLFSAINNKSSILSSTVSRENLDNSLENWPTVAYLTDKQNVFLIKASNSANSLFSSYTETSLDDSQSISGLNMVETTVFGFAPIYLTETFFQIEENQSVNEYIHWNYENIQFQSIGTFPINICNVTSDLDYMEEHQWNIIDVRIYIDAVVKNCSTLFYSYTVEDFSLDNYPLKYVSSIRKLYQRCKVNLTLFPFKRNTNISVQFDNSSRITIRAIPGKFKRVRLFELTQLNYPITSEQLIMHSKVYEKCQDVFIFSPCHSYAKVRFIAFKSLSLANKLSLHFKMSTQSLHVFTPNTYSCTKKFLFQSQSNFKNSRYPPRVQNTVLSNEFSTVSKNDLVYNPKFKYCDKLITVHESNKRTTDPLSILNVDDQAYTNSHVTKGIHFQSQPNLKELSGFEEYKKTEHVYKLDEIKMLSNNIEGFTKNHYGYKNEKNGSGYLPISKNIISADCSPTLSYLPDSQFFDVEWNINTIRDKHVSNTGTRNCETHQTRKFSFADPLIKPIASKRVKKLPIGSNNSETSMSMDILNDYTPLIPYLMKKESKKKFFPSLQQISSSVECLSVSSLEKVNQRIKDNEQCNSKKEEENECSFASSYLYPQVYNQNNCNHTYFSNSNHEITKPLMVSMWLQKSQIHTGSTTSLGETDGTSAFLNAIKISNENVLLKRLNNNLSKPCSVITADKDARQPDVGNEHITSLIYVDICPTRSNEWDDDINETSTSIILTPTVFNSNKRSL